jgi:hypothetical protein
MHKRPLQRTYCISFTNPNLLMLCQDIPTVYCENYTTHKYSVWSGWKVFNIKARGKWRMKVCWRTNGSDKFISQDYHPDLQTFLCSFIQTRPLHALSSCAISDLHNLQELINSTIYTQSLNLTTSYSRQNSTHLPQASHHTHIQVTFQLHSKCTYEWIAAGGWYF